MPGDGHDLARADVEVERVRGARPAGHQPADLERHLLDGGDGSGNTVSTSRPTISRTSRATS